MKYMRMIHDRAQQWLTAMCLLFSAACEGRIRNLGLGGKIGTFCDHFGTLVPFGTKSQIWDLFGAPVCITFCQLFSMTARWESSNIKVSIYSQFLYITYIDFNIHESLLWKCNQEILMVIWDNGKSTSRSINCNVLQPIVVTNWSGQWSGPMSETKLCNIWII